MKMSIDITLIEEVLPTTFKGAYNSSTIGCSKNRWFALEMISLSYFSEKSIFFPLFYKILLHIPV